MLEETGIAEAGASRIYVVFFGADDSLDEAGIVRSGFISFGPYHTLEISGGKMHVTPHEGDNFILAVNEGAGWRVNDGREGPEMLYPSVRIKTFLSPAEVELSRGERSPLSI